MNDDMNTNQANTHYVNDYQPPEEIQVVDTPAAPVAEDSNPSDNNQVAEAASDSQSLEDQNIFTLLGAENGTDQQKEEFLDELQQVIWEDFIENDTSLLLTEEEMAELKNIIGDSSSQDLEKQEETVVYLEKLIPDLEQIMLEKALELKEDMVRERAAGLKEFYSGDSSKQDQVIAAENLMDQGKWADAAKALNSI